MKDKIYIVGAASAGLAIIRKIADMPNVEFITTERAKEMNLMAAPTRTAMPIIAPPIFEMPFQAPPTRAERRKKARKKK